jgi:CBS domain-containing protein
VAEVMNRHPETIAADRPISEAARRMRCADVGDIVVLDGEQVLGIVTDLELVMRALARNGDSSTTVADAVPTGLAVVGPDTLVEHAAQLMREQELRRVPVLEGIRLVGVVSLADLAGTADRWL